MEDLGGKIHNARSNESLSQILIKKERKEVESIVERLIVEGEFYKWCPVYLP